MGNDRLAEALMAQEERDRRVLEGYTSTCPRCGSPRNLDDKWRLCEACSDHVYGNGKPEQYVRWLLRGIGQDPDREGLRETPRRVVAALRQMSAQPPFSFTTFDAEGMSEMIVQSGIPMRSLCEHHMLPFVGTASVAYIPNGKIVGLSKLARAVEHCAAGLQNQERITQAVADMLDAAVGPLAVGVVIRARHMCMEMRGVRAADVHTTTSCMRGAFMDDQKARAEFLRLAGL